MKIKIILLIFAVASVFLLPSCNSAINPLGGKETPELFPIMQRDASGYESEWGYINRKGEVVIQPQYTQAWFFSEGLAVACVENKCGYIDSSGKFVINPQFDFAHRFSEGLAAVTIENKIGYIDKTGKYVINPQFVSERRYDFFYTFSEGLARIKIGDKYGFIDKTGKIAINPQFEDALPFFDGLAASRIGSKWGFVDKEGKIIVNPQFDEAQPFINGLAAVKLGNQYGYIDKTGKIVINPQFDEALSFSDEGLAMITVGTKVGFIDKEGKYVINPQFASGKQNAMFEFGELDLGFAVSSELGRFSFSEGFAPIQISDSSGYVDKTGKITINPQFGVAFPFYGDLAIVFAKTDATGPVSFMQGEMAYIDKEGKYIWRETRTTAKTSTSEKEKIEINVTAPSSSTNSNMLNTNMATPNGSMSNTMVNSNGSMSNGSMSNGSMSTSSSNQKMGRLVTDSNLRSEPNKDSASVGIQFKDAKVTILDETSYERDGAISRWCKVRVTDYGCSKDTSLGCGKNSPSDADEGWVNAKSIQFIF